jgi:hypothetical protein
MNPLQTKYSDYNSSNLDIKCCDVFEKSMGIEEWGAELVPLSQISFKL